MKADSQILQGFEAYVSLGVRTGRLQHVKLGLIPNTEEAEKSLKALCLGKRQCVALFGEYSEQSGEVSVDLAFFAESK